MFILSEPSGFQTFQRTAIQMKSSLEPEQVNTKKQNYSGGEELAP